MESRKSNNKQSYEKPKLRVIELTADEVLAVGCKVYAGDPAGVGPGHCTDGTCKITLGS